MLQALWATCPPVTAVPADALVVGPDHGWFEAPGAARADLTSKPLHRSLLRALVVAHLSGRPAATSADLLTAGWPGERFSAASGLNRLRVAVSKLRSAGLRPVLESAEGGYRLTPGLVVVHAAED